MVNTPAQARQGPRLDLKQSQSLVMTPQLRQAIGLLQMNNLELSEYLEQELEQNPLLELDDGKRETSTEDAFDAPSDQQEDYPQTPEYDDGGHIDNDSPFFFVYLV